MRPCLSCMGFGAIRTLSPIFCSVSQARSRLTIKSISFATPAFNAIQNKIAVIVPKIFGTETGPIAAVLVKISLKPSASKRSTGIIWSHTYRPSRKSGKNLKYSKIIVSNTMSSSTKESPIHVSRNIFLMGPLDVSL